MILWCRPEAGWYATSIDGTYVSIVRENDRMWHLYIKRTAPPGDFVFDKLIDAKLKVEKVFEGRHGK